MQPDVTDHDEPHSRSTSRCHHSSRSSTHSNDSCHHSSPCDTPPHHSRSCSCHISCSPTVDHDDYPSYPEKVAQVHLLFAESPAMLAHPLKPAPARDTNLASRQLTSTPKPCDLPWNPSTVQIQDYYMDLLTGCDPKAKSSTGLGPITFFRCPSFKEQIYRISGHLMAAYAAQLQLTQDPSLQTSTCRIWRSSCVMLTSSCPIRTGS